MDNATPLRQRFLALDKDEELEVSLDEFRMTTIYSYCSDLGFATGRTFKCRRNRATRSYIITRTA